MFSVCLFVLVSNFAAQTGDASTEEEENLLLSADAEASLDDRNLLDELDSDDDPMNESFSIDFSGNGHVQYQMNQARNRNDRVVLANNFALGGVVLMVSAELSPTITFFNETVFEYGEGGENILDVERVTLNYRPSTAFQLTIGRDHTPLGFWNQRFHHGAWKETTVERPLLYAFEDDSGILPVHYVGAMAYGTLAGETVSLSYNLVIGNGRGAIPDSVQLIEDLNRSKMVSLLLTVEFPKVPGLGIGIAGLLDRIPAHPNALAPDATDDEKLRRRPISESLFGMHLFYIQDPVEIIAEATALTHRTGGDTFSFLHWGAYVQLAFSVDAFRPYYRFDLISINNIIDDLDGIQGGGRGPDPFYFGAGELVSTNQHTFGLRYDLATFIAIKGELRYVTADGKNPSYGGVGQVAFGF